MMGEELRRVVSTCKLEVQQLKNVGTYSLFSAALKTS